MKYTAWTTQMFLIITKIHSVHEISLLKTTGFWGVWHRIKPHSVTFPKTAVLNSPQWALRPSYIRSPWIKYCLLVVFFSSGATAPSAAGPPQYRGFRNTLRHTTHGRTPLDECSARRWALYLTTHNTHKRHPCPRGIRTHNPSKPAAADPRLKPRGHWDRLISSLRLQRWSLAIMTKVTLRIDIVSGVSILLPMTETDDWW
jgi:hypothetical protein